jgi:hypothetical protein
MPYQRNLPEIRPDREISPTAIAEIRVQLGLISGLFSEIRPDIRPDFSNRPDIRGTNALIVETTIRPDNAIRLDFSYQA